MQIRMGIRELEYPGINLEEMRHSNELMGDIQALHARMAEDGYLLIRDILDRDKVLEARSQILHYMNEHEAMEPGSRPLDGVMGQYGKSINLPGKRQITHNPHVLEVLESPALFEFFGRYFEEPAVTFNYKWLRAVAQEQFTGAHYDVIYMGRGSKQLHTTWVPLGDIPVEQGTLAVCVGSHTQPRFQKLRETYGQMDVDRDRIDGWFTTDPLEVIEKFGGQWVTTSFNAGDVLIFGMYTLHASTTNVTDRWRLSCDIRFQPKSEPMDARWAGKEPTAHNVLGQPGETFTPMAQARKEWNV